MPARRLWSAAIIGVALSVAIPVQAAETPPSPGDPATGKGLYTGAIRMRNGGAACGACHALSRLGPTMGATLGPDLSHSFEGTPAEAIDGILQDLPFPTMVPIYTGHALTAQERAHLTAFLVSAAGPAAPGSDGVAVWAGITAAVLLALLAVGARRRKGSTRASLVARPPSPERPPLVPRRAHETPEPVTVARTARGGSR